MNVNKFKPVLQITPNPSGDFHFGIDIGEKHFQFHQPFPYQTYFIGVMLWLGIFYVAFGIIKQTQ